MELTRQNSVSVIVVDPDGLSSTEVLEKHLEPPSFITNETNKGRFAIKLNRWIYMLSVYAEDIDIKAWI